MYDITDVSGKLALVQVPSVINRYIELPCNNGTRIFCFIRRSDFTFY